MNLITLAFYMAKNMNRYLQSKIFKSYLVNSFYIIPDKLYREFKSTINSLDLFKNGKIYFIVKRPKSRFKKVKIDNNCIINFNYANDGFFSKAHKIPLANLLHGLNSINKDVYPTP
ncbi:hypothetical protein NAG84_18675, partial [Proteus terrae]|uniref:hypothetical protein n=1 Tax=Proteus terrae TaxID=1574161 RepID=UPI00209485CC